MGIQSLWQSKGELNVIILWKNLLWWLMNYMIYNLNSNNPYTHPVRSHIVCYQQAIVSSFAVSVEQVEIVSCNWLQQGQQSQQTNYQHILELYREFYAKEYWVACIVSREFVIYLIEVPSCRKFQFCIQNARMVPPKFSPSIKSKYI